MRTRVIGIGNELRGDDAAGLLVARRLRELTLPGVEAVEADEATDLVELLGSAERAILVDAVVGASAPGDVVRLREPSRGRLAATTHNLRLHEALGLARVLYGLPTSMTVYGIEGRLFDVGAALTPEVAAGVQAAVERILRELEP